MAYTNQEAGSMIRTRSKPYNHIKPQMDQGAFSRRLASMENGTMKPVTARAFMKTFGFLGDYNDWEIDPENNDWELIKK